MYWRIHVYETCASECRQVFQIKLKAHALNTRLFEHLCEDMDAEHKCLLLYTEVRWLSREKSLNRVFELREPLQRFLLGKNSDFAGKFSDEKWVLKLAYLYDISNLFNELNLSLQGKMTTLLKLADKVAAFNDKFKLWKQHVNKGYWHVSNISRDFERQRAWASVLRPCEQSIACTFIRVQALFFKR